MPFSFLKMKAKPIVGIDISASSVKVLALTSKTVTEGLPEAVIKYHVEHFAIEPLSPGLVVDKMIKDVDSVAKAVKLAIEHANISKKSAVAIAVSGSSVITRVIQMNAEFSEHEIVEQIEVEADRYIPYPLEEVSYDFEVLGISEKHPELVDVLLAASRTENVEMRVQAIVQAGLKVKIVDLESLAIVRAFKLIAHHFPDKGMTQRIALLDIGSMTTTLYVLEKLQIIYTREQNFGGRQLMDEIQRRYGLSFEEALAAEKYGGLPEDYETEVLGPFKEAVLQQANRALQFFFSSGEHGELHHLVLMGGAAAIVGLDKFLQENLSMKTMIANPFSNMSLSETVNSTMLTHEASSLMLCCGLALRNFDT